MFALAMAARGELLGMVLRGQTQVEPRPLRLCPGTAGPGSKNTPETHPGGTLLEKQGSFYY